jgi:hypothetical protein
MSTTPVASSTVRASTVSVPLRATKTFSPVRSIVST